MKDHSEEVLDTIRARDRDSINKCRDTIKRLREYNIITENKKQLLEVKLRECE